MIKGLSLSLIASSFAFSAHAMAPINIPMNVDSKASVAATATSDNEPVRQVPAPDTGAGDGMGTFEQGRDAHFQETDNDAQDEISCRNAQDQKNNDGVLKFCGPKIVAAYFQLPEDKDQFNRMAFDQMAEDPQFLYQKASATLDCAINVNLSTQRLTYSVDGQQYGPYLISSARAGYYTPTGKYSIYLFDKNHKSKKYNMSPMPYAMFFKGGWAIHGTYDRGLGTPHSHGCVRMNPAQAGELYARMQASGERSVCISGTPPGPKSAHNKAVDDDEAPAAPAPRRSKKNRNNPSPYDQEAPQAPREYYAPPQQEAPSQGFSLPGLGGLFGQ